MSVSIVLILTGFLLLIKGADILIEGACSLAKRFHVSDLVIGLTLIAFGTSAPEFVVCLIATIKGDGGISAGNIIGSNIANICLILGIAGLLTPLTADKHTVRRDIPFCIAATILLFIVITKNNTPYLVSRAEASALIIMLIIYLFTMIRSSKKEIEKEAASDKLRSPTSSAVMISLGLIGLIGGGEITVHNAVIVATSLGVSQEMIGLTIIAIGTSLPELATTIMAIRKGKHDIAMGNIIGSNILNTCLILGTTSLIKPIKYTQSLTNDMILLTATTMLLFVFMFTGKKHKIDRWEAAVFVLAYVTYIGYVIHRG